MSVSSTTTQVSVTLNAPLQSVNIPFAFYDPSDLVVTVGGALQTRNTHYTVTGGNGSTGSITMMAAGPSSGSLLCYRLVPNTQPLDLTQGGPMPPEEIEKSLDRLTYIAQQLSALLDIAVRYAPGTAAQTPLALGTVPAVVGTSGNGTTSMLTIDALIELLNLDGAVVDRPLKTFADAAGRAASVPDFVGQLGVQLDLIASPRLASLYVATAGTAGSWSVINITTNSIPELAITNGKLAELCVTGAKVAEATLAASKLIAGDRPARVFANAAARTAATPDFIGQLAVQVDLIASPRLASVYIGSALSAGSWVVIDITSNSIPDLAITTGKINDLAVNNGKVADLAITNPKVAAATLTGDKLVGLPWLRKSEFVLTSGIDATFTPTAGVRALLVRVWGAGGGAGGIPAPSGAGSSAVGGSGGGGGYAEKLIPINPAHTYKYTIGAGGSGGAAGAIAGTAGGATTFFEGVSGTTAVVRATGGALGAAGNVTTFNTINGGALAGVGNLGDILLNGRAATPRSTIINGAIGLPSFPGCAPFFEGGRSPADNADGIVGNNYGVGGSAPFSAGGSTARAGGNGAPGVIIITEFF
jgi:hypothetical protein